MNFLTQRCFFLKPDEKIKKKNQDTFFFFIFSSGFKKKTFLCSWTHPFSIFSDIILFSFLLI